MRIEFYKEKLPLSNEGSLSIFFIGTGSAFSKKLYQTNILVVKGSDHVLIDCGATCFRSLADVNVSPADIKNVYITHSHADHIGGLEELFMTARYMAQYKPNLIIGEKYQKILWEESLQGGSAYSEIKNDTPLGIEAFCNIQRPVECPNHPREMFEVAVGSIHLRFVRTRHIPDNAKSWRDAQLSYSVILDERVLFSSDTQYDPELLEEIETRYNTEYIFHDCQLFTGGVHASLDELGQLPASLKRKTFLMHYGDEWEKFDQQRYKLGFLAWAKQHHAYIFD